LTFATELLPPEHTDLQSTMQPGPGAMPWTVIFGGNGCGKSTVLKAIGLALAGNKDPGALGMAARMLKTGTQDGFIEIKLGPDTVRTAFFRDRTSVKMDSPQVTPVEAGATLMLGFPALRGAPSPNPTGPAELRPHDPEPADLLPMVVGDVDKRIASLKQWIVNTMEQARGGLPRAIAIRKLLDSIIASIVPGEVNGLADLPVGSYQICVKTPEGVVPFDDLSQGMMSIFNWLGVAVQRLYDFYPDSETPEKESTVVLIDEIDTHLHPDWQRRVVELTRRHFPNMQVIATSHSPLLAGALHKEEICVMERDPRTRKVGQLPITMETYGMRAERILTSAIFGLTSDRNPEVERKIHRYVELFQSLTPLDGLEKEELRTLTIEMEELGYLQQPRRERVKIDSAAVAVLKEQVEEAKTASTGSGSAVP
jgi:predicted ATP-binding protein involved in virulence